MAYRSLSARRTTRDEYFYKSTRPGTDAGVVSSGMISTNPLSGMFNENELMRSLNDRLAGFIEKVHHLEYQNHLLERDIGEIRGKAKPASILKEEYGPELRKLRQLVQDITHQKHQIEIEHEHLEEELSNLRGQHEQEARGRADAESNIVLLKRDVNDAYQAKLQLDQKAQALVEEIHFLKEHHKAEISEMFDQIQNAQVTVKAREFGNPGVTAALRDIRAQLEGQTVSDVQQIEETFRSQFARLTEAAERKREALKATQQEMQEYRRSLQAKSIELDCAEGTREALETQLHDVEDHHRKDMIHYQNTIKELENELMNCKFDMSGYLREYQDLLNVKMALDVEILSYRKLLCGEEARFSMMSDPHMSLPYIYHQSPVYTLPRLSRPGGPHRRAEPQYKFVEEIITETTREIEMSEFEDTGSEETEMEKDEQYCSKRDKGGSDEEKDNKDGGEEDGEQMPDSVQNQVASVVNLVHGDDDDNDDDEVDDCEKDQTSKVESEENAAVDNEGPHHCDTDTNTQSKVVLLERLHEEENEQYRKVAEDTKEEKEAAVTMVTVEKELFSNQDDLKEDEDLEKADDGQKGDAEKESFIPAQVNKLIDETAGQDTTQEQSSTQVQDTETADFAAETKSTVFVKTEQLWEKAQVSTSTTSMSEEKENSDKDTKGISKFEAAKGDEVAKRIEDARNKESSLQSELKSLPEVEDGTQKGLQKENTTVNSEIKELHEGAPKGSQAQNSEPSQSSEKIKDPHGKTEVAESKAEK